MLNAPMLHYAPVSHTNNALRESRHQPATEEASEIGIEAALLLQTTTHGHPPTNDPHFLQSQSHHLLSVIAYLVELGHPLDVSHQMLELDDH